ncbi:MAG TPA: helix-turn-helix domain-containing protein [Thermomicrobiales bacterium]|nr:helix-turn-helix domain-containing protein [Thermomicrobiales bacterium]
MTDEPKLAYSIKEAAQALGIHTDLAYRMAQSGELPAVKLGARWLVPIAALEQWLVERAGVMTDPPAGGTGSPPGLVPAARVHDLAPA